MDVYGSLRVKYEVFRTTHTLSLKARPDAVEHFWSAWVMALVSNNEPGMLKLDPPPTAEELSEMGLTTCPDYNFELDWLDDSDKPPSVSPGRKEEVSESSLSTDQFLNLEQEPLSSWQDSVTPADISNMLLMAMSGMSTASYQNRRCEGSSMASDGKLTITLAIYAWPHAMDMEYDLLPANCVLGEKKIINLWRELDVAFEGSGTAKLPFLMDGANGTWLTGCYGKHSVSLPEISLSVSGGSVYASAPCYGVARVKGYARGYRYSVTKSFTKATEDGWSAIKDVKMSVTARWKTSEGEEQSSILELQLPSCVEQLLEACPSGGPRVNSVFAEENPDGKTLRVYYDSCRGTVLRTSYVKR